MFASATRSPLNCLSARRLAVGAADDHEITVEVAQPRLTVAGRGVHVDVLDDLGPQCSSAANRCVQIVELEPNQDAVAIPPAVGINEVRAVPPRSRRGAGAPARRLRAADRRGGRGPTPSARSCAWHRGERRTRERSRASRTASRGWGRTEGLIRQRLPWARTPIKEARIQRMRSIRCFVHEVRRARDAAGPPPASPLRACRSDSRATRRS